MKTKLAWKKSQNYTKLQRSKIHRNETRSAGKSLDSQLCHYQELRHLPQDCWLCWAPPPPPPRPRTLLPYMTGRQRVIYNWPPSIQASLGGIFMQGGWGVNNITQILHGYSFTGKKKSLLFPLPVCPGCHFILLFPLPACPGCHFICINWIINYANV